MERFSYKRLQEDSLCLQQSHESSSIKCWTFLFISPPILWATSTCKSWAIIPEVQGSGAGLGKDCNQKPVGATAFILQIPREPRISHQGCLWVGCAGGKGEKRSCGIIKYCTWSFYSLQQKMIPSCRPRTLGLQRTLSIDTSLTTINSNPRVVVLTDGADVFRAEM